MFRRVPSPDRQAGGDSHPPSLTLGDLTPPRQDPPPTSERAVTTGEESHLPSPLVIEGLLRQGPAGTPDRLAQLLESIRARQARVGIIGLGYVGLPLARCFA